MDYPALLNKAASHLSRRMYTRRELERKLKPAADAELIAQALDALESDGYLDDQKYAEMYISDCVALKKWGAARIRRELLQKGVSAEIVNTAFVESDEDPSANLSLLIEGQLGEGAAVSRKEYNKLMSKLMYRGYSSSEIRKTFEELGCKIVWRHESLSDEGA